MTHQRNAVNIAQVAHVFKHLLGILNLVGNGHIHKFALALAVAVEVEANGSNAVLAEGVGNQVEHLPFLAAAKAMTEHHHRTALALLQGGFLYHGSQFPLAAIDGERLTGSYFWALTRSKRLGERLFHLVGKHSREHYLALGIQQYHRGNPLHAKSLRHVRLAHLLQLAHLGVVEPVFFNSCLPGIGIRVERNAHKLHALGRKVAKHALHVGNILAAVGAPRGPEINQRPAAFGQLAQFHGLAIQGLHLKVGSHRAGSHQILGILCIGVGGCSPLCQGQLRPCHEEHQYECCLFHNLYIIYN